MNNKFQENLRKIRKDNNLSQEQLADELGVSRQAISKWESGTAYPEMDKIIQLCEKFNVNMDYAEKNLGVMFKIETDQLGAQLKAQFDILKSIVDKKREVERQQAEEIKRREEAGEKIEKTKMGSISFVPLEEDRETYNAALKEFLRIYSKAAIIEIENYKKAMYSDYKNPSIKHADFDSVMAGVIKDNLMGANGKIDYISLAKFGWRFGNSGFLMKIQGMI